MPKKTTPTFEDQFAALESILAQLEGGELTLEESLKHYEQGIGALRGCREILQHAEQRMEELSADPAPQ